MRFGWGVRAQEEGGHWLGRDEPARAPYCNCAIRPSTRDGSAQRNHAKFRFQPPSPPCVLSSVEVLSKVRHRNAKPGAQLGQSITIHRHASGHSTREASFLQQIYSRIQTDRDRDGVPIHYHRHRFPFLAKHQHTLRFMTTVYAAAATPSPPPKPSAPRPICRGDRVTLGVGVGWQKAEFELCGQDFHTRGRRIDEALDILRGLMSGALTEHHGAHYRFEPLQMSPGTRRPVPVMVGGYSDAAMRRAARCDGWLGVQHEEAELYPLLDRLARCRDELGRSEEPFEIWTGLRNPSRDAIARLREAGVTMVNGANFFDADGKARPSGIDFKKRRIEAFARRLF